jgi:hypothetical protein
MSALLSGSIRTLRRREVKVSVFMVFDPFKLEGGDSLNDRRCERALVVLKAW